jgi:hypothetical protein
MIIVKLQGGLGNQLFQWAYALSLSIANKTDYALDLTFLNSYIHGITPRQYELNKFHKIGSNIQIINNVLDISNIEVVKDATQILYDPNINYYLDDYFQSPKYFKGYRQQILDLLQPNYDQSNRVNEIIDPSSKSITVSMHIRRTDYISQQGAHHNILSLDYYQNAINAIGHYDQLYIFSDDINWCKQNLNFERMRFCEHNDNIIDLFLMSRCTHNIIANSSFSWWGSWLNQNPQKIIIFPTVWSKTQSSVDLVY